MSLLLYSCGSNTSIDAFEYMEVKFSGINGKGKAEIVYDDAMEQVLLQAMGYKEGDDPFLYLDVYMMADAVVTPDNNLSNGDKVSIKISTNQATLDKYKIKFKNLEKTYTVDGLGEATTLDIFDEVELVYEGASPFLNVMIKNRSQDEFLKTISYTTENRSNVAIGDIVTVKATFSETVAESKGYVIEESEKTFTVDSADKYVEDFSDIDSATMEKIIKEATDKMESELAKNAGRIFFLGTENLSYSLSPRDNSIDKPEVVSLYLLTKKNGEFVDSSFSLYDLAGASCVVVFSTHGKNKDNDETVYSAVAVPNIITNLDGTISVSYSDKWVFTHYDANEDTVYEKTYKNLNPITKLRNNHNILKIISNKGILYLQGVLIFVKEVNNIKQLVISEKPSVADTIAKVLGVRTRKDGYFENDKYYISWCVGHLVSSCLPTAYDEKYKQWKLDHLPIIPDKFKYTVLDDKKKQFNILKNLMHMGDVDGVVCATDSGREGEPIFRLVYDMARCTKPIKRLWISSLEDKAILDGMANLRDSKEFDNLHQSAVCREQSDWLVGMNLSRLFSIIYNSKLSIGRVKTPTLAMITQRDQTIKAFTKSYKYSAVLNCDKFEFCGEKLESESKAKEIADKCENGSIKITQINRNKKTINPPKLYDLTTLQREANRLYKYTAQQTLNIVQSLYESKLVT